MNYLLDTHLLLWWQSNDPALPKTARSLIADPQHRIIVSALSLWEIIIKSGKGKLEADINEIHTAAQADGFELLPFRDAHALELQHLPPLHQDPFDRGLIATARAENLILLSSDSLVAAYGHPVQQL